MPFCLQWLAFFLLLVPALSVPIDRAAMLALRNIWGSQLGWDGDYYCGWPDVQCGRDDVMALHLDGKNLTGSIPSALYNLSSLTWLELSGNHLTGAIPIDLCKLRLLVSLDLSRNQLTGSIPSCMNAMERLQALNMNDNLLTGTIPDIFDKVDTLLYIRFTKNNLTGTIPQSINSLTQLRSLALNYNHLNGTIPEMGLISNLVDCDLSYNQITGTIPMSFSNLTNLTSLYLSDNLLTGTIPSFLGDISLRYLRLEGNHFTGLIPPNLCKIYEYYPSAWLFLFPTNGFYSCPLPRCCLETNHFCGFNPICVNASSTISSSFTTEPSSETTSSSTSVTTLRSFLTSTTSSDTSVHTPTGASLEHSKMFPPLVALGIILILLARHFLVCLHRKFYRFADADQHCSRVINDDEPDPDVIHFISNLDNHQKYNPTSFESSFPPFSPSPTSSSSGSTFSSIETGHYLNRLTRNDPTFTTLFIGSVPDDTKIRMSAADLPEDLSISLLIYYYSHGNLSQSDFVSILASRFYIYNVHFVTNDVDFHCLAKLLYSNSTLSSLFVCNRTLGDEGAAQIATMLASNTHLKTLSLRSTGIDREGGIRIGEALKINSTLTFLDLYDNNIGNNGGTEIGRALISNSTLSCLYLGDNNIGDKGCVVIGETLQANCNLHSLYLGENKIGVQGCVAIGKALKTNTSLTSLYLGINNIGDVGFKLIATGAASSKSLFNLSVIFNKITTIPLDLANASSLVRLYLRGNLLIEPKQEFVNSATLEQIKTYLRAKRTTIARLKLLIVGFENTGKTYLCNNIIHRFQTLAELQQYMGDDRSTHGISIRSWHVPSNESAPSEGPLTFNIFDFAGQPAYYSNHQNFLAQYQAVYLVVFRSDTFHRDAGKQVKHWLNFISSQIHPQWRAQFLTGQLLKPTVIVLGTHVDSVGKNENDLHRAWYITLVHDPDYQSVLDLHAEILFINHNDFNSVEELRNLLVSAGRKQLFKSPAGLEIFVNLFPKIDNIRQSTDLHALFRATDEFRHMLIETNPNEIDVIDHIGTEGLLTSLQAMGEVIYLPQMSQVCIEPQRLFDMLAQFVRQQTEDLSHPRNQHKAHVVHRMGMVALSSIKTVCNLQNQRAKSDVISHESLLATLKMMKLCVEIRSGLFLFPSLLPDAIGHQFLENYFLDQERRFDVQWKLGSSHVKPSIADQLESQPTETAPPSLMFGIHIDLVRSLSSEGFQFEFWADAVYLKRTNLMEVLILSSAGKDVDATLRLSIRHAKHLDVDVVEFIRYFDKLVDIIKWRLDRSLFRSVIIMGICTNCPKLTFIDKTYTFPVTVRTSAVHISHEDVDCSSDSPIFYCNPLRRILGDFDASQLRFCSANVRGVSTPDSKLLFSSDLFLKPVENSPKTAQYWLNPPSSPMPSSSSSSFASSSSSTHISPLSSSLFSLPPPHDISFPPPAEYDVFLCHRGSDPASHEQVKAEFAIPLSKFLIGHQYKIFLDCDELDIVSAGPRIPQALVSSKIAVIMFSEGFVDGIMQKKNPWCLFELRVRYAYHQYLHAQELDRKPYPQANFGTFTFGIAIAPFDINKHCITSIYAKKKLPLVSREDLNLEEFIWMGFRRSLPAQFREFMDDRTLTLERLLPVIPILTLSNKNDNNAKQADFLNLKNRLDLLLK